MAAPIRTLEAFAVSLPRDVPYLGPLGPGEAINAKGYYRSARQSHDLPVDRHVGAREGDRGGRNRGLGRDLRHRRAAGGPRDPARSADPVRRRSRRARCRFDLRRALRPAARARRVGRLLRRCAGGDRHRALGRRGATGRRAAVRGARRCAQCSALPAYVVGPAEGHAGRAGRARARLRGTRLSRRQVRRRRVARRASSRRCTRCAPRFRTPT